MPMVNLTASELHILSEHLLDRAKRTTNRHRSAFCNRMAAKFKRKLATTTRKVKKSNTRGARSFK